MSKLLINENPLVLLPSLAVVFGVPEALFLQQLHYWLNTSKISRDGKKWTYNTVEEWNEQLPFYSKSTLERLLASLKKLGVIEMAQLAEHRSNRVNYYTINYALLDEIAAKHTQDHAVKMTDSHRQNDGIKKPVKTVKLTESSHQFDGIQSVKLTESIPSKCGDGYTENTRDSTETTAENAPDSNLPEFSEPTDSRKKTFAQLKITTPPEQWVEQLKRQHTNLPNERIKLEFIDFESYWGSDERRNTTFTVNDWKRKFLASVAKNLMSRPVRMNPVLLAAQAQESRQTETPQPVDARFTFGSGEFYALKDLQKIDPEITQQFVIDLAQMRDTSVNQVLRDLKNEMTEGAA